MGWFTKTVEVEKVVTKYVDRPVPGEASKAVLYLAYKTRTEKIGEGIHYSHRYEVHDSLGYYPTCSAAFEAHPGCQVKEVDGIRIGKEFFAVGSLTPVTVTKPKRPKGKA